MRFPSQLFPELCETYSAQRFDMTLSGRGLKEGRKVLVDLPFRLCEPVRVGLGGELGPEARHLLVLPALVVRHGLRHLDGLLNVAGELGFLVGLLALLERLERGDLRRVVGVRLDGVSVGEAALRDGAGGFELPELLRVGQGLLGRRGAAQWGPQSGEEVVGVEGERAGRAESQAHVARAKRPLDFPTAIERLSKVFGHDDAEEPNAVPGELDVRRYADHRWSEWTTRMDHRGRSGNEKSR